MSKINWLKNFLRNLIENIFVQIILSLITLGAIVYFKDKLIDFFNYNVKIWQISIFLAVILFLIFIYNLYKSKSIHKFLKYGMEWHVNIEKDKVSSIKGPFCPRCLLEMTESKPFQCSICGTKYTALNPTNVEDAQQTVKKIIEAELRGGKILIMDWSTSTYYYPYSSFSLKNNGASIAKDITINIKFELGNEKRNIETYTFEKIDADREIKIEKSDPLRKVHDILEDMKLIKFYSQEVGQYVEDEYGNEICAPDYLDWVEINKEFSCDIQVDLNYSLKGKTKIEINKYSLEFKFIPRTPEEDLRFENNCEIRMRQIK